MGCDWFLSNARWTMEVETPTLAADNYGGQTETYANLGTFFCVFEPVQGRDSYNFEAAEPKVRHKATIRYDDDLSDLATIQKCRFTIDDRYFKPLFVKLLDVSRKMYGKHYIEITFEDNGAINE